MTAHRLTNVEIAARIVPNLLRWPAAEIAKTIAWDRMRDCVDALHGLARAVDSNCLQAEQDRDLSPDGIARRRAQVGRQALIELTNFKPLQLAEKAVAENLALLEKRMVEMPQSPTSVAEVMLAQEIRDFVSEQDSPIDFVVKSMSDRRVLTAVLSAPAFLSGLTDAEWNLVRARARQALHPEQTDMEKLLTKALGEVREGVAAAKRMLLERCEMREDDDGQFRSIREPMPRGALAEAKSVVA